MAAAIVIYVIYRLVTDRPSGEKRHPLYPMVSNPTDRMFPEKGDYLSWVGYVLVIVGFAGLIGVIFIELTEKVLPFLSGFIGLSITSGFGLFLWSKHKQRSRK